MKTVCIGNKTYTIALYEFLRDNYSTGINDRETSRSIDYVHETLQSLFLWTDTDEGCVYWGKAQQEFLRISKKVKVKRKHEGLI